METKIQTTTVGEGEKEKMIIEKAHEIFANWNESLQTKDPQKVAALYSKDCTFLPTVSPEFKRGQDGAEEYFHHFLEKDPNGTIVEDAVQVIPAGSILHSGRYDFEVGPENERQIVEARFSFVYKPDGEIMHHHSSKKPVA
ncbi:MAG: SgcJ/EcaC family oxidoreductase [Candidatus Moraniibacteriota bacterium]